METNHKSPFAAALMPGLLFGAVLVIWSLATYMLDLTFKPRVSWVTYMLMLGMLIVGGFQYRTAKGGYLTYGQAWVGGFLLTLVATVISTLFSIVLFNVIDPGMYDEMMRFMESEMLKKPELSEEMIDAAMDMNRKIFTPVTMPIIGLVGSLITGMILSLLSSLLVRRENPNPTPNF